MKKFVSGWYAIAFDPYIANIVCDVLCRVLTCTSEQCLAYYILIKNKFYKCNLIDKGYVYM